MLLPHPNYPNNPLCKILADFRTGSDVLPQDVREWLDTKVAPALQRGDWVYLRGMASNAGNAQSNMDLSNRRAHQVAYYLLVKPNVDPSHITRVDAIGTGFSGGDPNDNSARYRAVELIITPQRLAAMPRPAEQRPSENAGVQLGHEIPLERLGIRSRLEHKYPLEGVKTTGSFIYKISLQFLAAYETRAGGQLFRANIENRGTTNPSGRGESVDINVAIQEQFGKIEGVVQGRLGTNALNEIFGAAIAGKGIGKMTAEFFNGWSARLQGDVGTIGPVEVALAGGLVVDLNFCFVEGRFVLKLPLEASRLLGDGYTGRIVARCEVRIRVGLTPAAWARLIERLAQQSRNFSQLAIRLRTLLQELIEAGARRASSAIAETGSLAARSGRAGLVLARRASPYALRFGRFLCDALDAASPWLLAIDLAIMTRNVTLFITEVARSEGVRQGQNFSFGREFTMVIFGYGDLPNQPNETEAKRAAMRLIDAGHRTEVQAILLLQFGWGMSGVDSMDAARALGERTGLYLRRHDNVRFFLEHLHRSIRLFS